MITVFLLGTEEAKLENAKGCDLKMGEEIYPSDLVLSKTCF